MKRVSTLKRKMQKAAYSSIGILAAQSSFANEVSIIPLSNAQKQSLKNDGLDGSILTLLQSTIIPIVEVCLGLGVLWMAGSGVFKAFKEYGKDRDFGALKETGFAVAFVVFVGGGIGYMLDLLRTTNFVA